MKKNTCGTHSCPPASASDTAKTINEVCTATVVSTGGKKVRKVIAKVNVIASVEANICLPHAAKELKSVRKNVHLTECQVVSLSNPNDPDDTKAPAQLFVAGFVHKNFQFTDGVSPFVRDHSVNVPFHCIVSLNNINPHVDFSDKNVLGENQFIQLANNEMEGDRCVTGGISFEVFNEPIECELNKAAIFEKDFLRDFDSFGRFKRVHEKMTINMLITLTQFQTRS
ncbi:hypothetical protein DFP93_1099 [Aneurinibacillus soli]|uniref:Uncharacterized protein n=1 Tax=Aneurinibacillus soli TaxID=1500254 RepID=A0A0U5AVV2_9BACL|nr:hypothetical protein [Aneurinibacillus soli]PYE61310.1 hypothetical protein DFP93_1099 [Aneurinibacillus soli]BAU27861.1 hypothetical protein CB4_02035 [Aneurinibacillus soli]